MLMDIWTNAFDISTEKALILVISLFLNKS